MSRLLVNYLGLTAMLQLLWEVLQLPLYTLWYDSSTSAIAYAVVHCTAGDVLIAGFSFLGAHILLRAGDWPESRYRQAASVSILLGVTYTAFSEWNNTVVTHSWAYSNWMPTLWGIGLSPIAQWLIIPAFAFWKNFPRRDA